MSASVATPDQLLDRQIVDAPFHAQSGWTFCLLRAGQIDNALRDDWDALRQSNSAFRSPFFSWSFIERVAQLVPSVEIGVARAGGAATAIFPFQRHRRTVAKPVGVGINDAHGLIAGTGTSPNLIEMMEHCGLKSFPFHAAPPSSSAISEHQFGTTRSFLSDLTIDPRGYEHFLRKTRNTIDKQGQKTRRMMRDLGPLRFEFDCRDPRLLERLFELKCDQYQRTHTYNILGVPWIRDLLQRLHVDTTAPVRGILNVLYAGDLPVALHFGMLEGDHLHYWFPVFDPAAGFGSPGTQLFLEVAREARERGIVAIDMGYGEQPYKTKLTNVVTEMSYGIVDTSPWRCWSHRQRLAWQNAWRGLRVRELVKPYARKLLPGFGGDKYQV